MLTLTMMNCQKESRRRNTEGREKGKERRIKKGCRGKARKGTEGGRVEKVGEWKEEKEK